jgi:uncharacterized membrane protein YfcA
VNFTHPELVELFIAYGITAGAMLAVLLLVRAERRAYLRWPVFSAMAMVLGIVVWNQLRKHALPPEWAITRPREMYVGALVLYGLFGAGLGWAVHRLTRSKPLDVPWADENEKSSR